MLEQADKTPGTLGLNLEAACGKACLNLQIPSLIRADLQKTSTTYTVFDIFKSRKLLLFLLVSIYTW